MTKAQKAFFEQMGSDTEEIKQDFLTNYAYGLVDKEETEPIQYAVDTINSDWDLEPAATSQTVQPWLEDKQAVNFAKLRVEEEIRKQQALFKFSEQREAGATFMASMKAAGEDAPFITRALEKANAFQVNPERLKILRQARREEYQVKAFKARQKAYRMLSNKVEKALKDADFSSLPADKLADIMLKLTQVSKEDTPPEMSIKLDWTREV